MSDTPVRSKVLIVDDTLKNIQVLGSMLRSEGYQIYVARNGVQAIASTQKIGPDLILLDVMMPEMDGFEACKRLKADPKTADIPIIFLTAKVEKEDVVHGLQLGAVDYVTKPFNSSELLTRVDTHLTLCRLRKELEQRVQELDVAMGEIQRIYREQESFLRHELNNALGPIKLYADMLLTRAQPPLAERSNKWANRIHGGVEKMAALIEAMRKLQAFERGDAVLDMTAVDLEALLDDIVADLELVWGFDITLEVEKTAAETMIQADKRILSGVFENLIKNAIEHVKDLFYDEERTIHVKLFNEDENVVVTVTNQGDPIPADRLETFFEKFNSTKKDKGGTGLGTTYAFYVTQAHGGRISVASSADEGTTLTVRIPVTA